MLRFLSLITCASAWLSWGTTVVRTNREESTLANATDTLLQWSQKALQSVRDSKLAETPKDSQKWRLASATKDLQKSSFYMAEDSQSSKIADKAKGWQTDTMDAIEDHKIQNWTEKDNVLLPGGGQMYMQQFWRGKGDYQAIILAWAVSKNSGQRKGVETFLRNLEDYFCVTDKDWGGSVILTRLVGDSDKGSGGLCNSDNTSSVGNDFMRDLFKRLYHTLQKENSEEQESFQAIMGADDSYEMCVDEMLPEPGYLSCCSLERRITDSRQKIDIGSGIVECDICDRGMPCGMKDCGGTVSSTLSLWKFHCRPYGESVQSKKCAGSDFESFNHVRMTKHNMKLFDCVQRKKPDAFKSFKVTPEFIESKVHQLQTCMTAVKKWNFDDRFIDCSDEEQYQSLVECHSAKTAIAERSKIDEKIMTCAEVKSNLEEDPMGHYKVMINQGRGKSCWDVSLSRTSTQESNVRCNKIYEYVHLVSEHEDCKKLKNADDEGWSCIEAQQCRDVLLVDAHRCTAPNWFAGHMIARLGTK